ncbi:MAG: hypothetical protein IPL65_08040 [Lewinellaceae bacterium]|nr:hypothetical protein [Lewinellaceae bacterium]
MTVITAAAIDKVIDGLDNLSEDQYEKRMEAFAAAQPVIFAYLFDEETFHLLNDDEKGYLQYLALICWSVIEKQNGATEPVGEEEIGETEEANYEILENDPGKNFRQRLDPFFDGYDQEDLLAFAEEAVLEDEHEPDALVSKEGRETIFVALKTIIDVLT